MMNDELSPLDVHEFSNYRHIFKLTVSLTVVDYLSTTVIYLLQYITYYIYILYLFTTINNLPQLII